MKQIFTNSLRAFTFAVSFLLALSLYAVICCLLGWATTATAQDKKTVYIPASWEYNATTQEYIEGGNPALSWSYNRSKQSDHAIIFWMQGFGSDPTACEPALAFDPDDILRVAEDCYNLNVNTLGFRDTPYKILILMNYDAGWVCYGGGYDFRCPALWLSPSTVHPAGQALAHEVGHSFHYMSYGIDSNGGADRTCWTGFHGAIGNGSSTWEATAQWQSVNVYPSMMFGQSYPLFGLECNYAQTHEWMRYQSYWWFYYLCQHYGDIKTVSGVWNHHETEIKDFNQVLMDYKGLSVNELYALYLDYAMHCATYDYTVAEPFRNDFIGNFAYHYIPVGQGKIQVAYASAPQSTGFNVIPLEVPADGGDFTARFTALEPGCPLAEGDQGLFYNGTPTLYPINQKTYNKMSASNKATRGFRIGFVYLLKNGQRIYKYEDRRYGTGTGEVTEDITSSFPANTERAWMVVTPAPSRYFQHLWNEYMEDDDQWPYQVEFVGTSIPGSQRYYLYDAQNDRFFSRGGQGGTEAVTDQFGLPVVFGLASGGQTLQMLDNTGAYIGRSAGAATVSTTAAKTVWQVNTTDAGTTFCAADGTSGNSYLQAHADGTLTCSASETDATRWQVLTASQRNKILAERRDAQEREVARLANIGMGSLSLAQHAENDFTATDMTDRITNASMATTTNGWNLQGAAASAEASVQEVYQGTGTTLSQSITGLPKGMYRFSLYAFYRDGWPAACVGFQNSGFTQMSNAWMQANDQRIQIADWAGQRSGDQYPNWRSEARVSFDQGRYRNDLYIFVGDDGNLDLSFGTPQHIEAGWFCFANATLTYYGMNDEYQPEYSIIETDVPQPAQRSVSNGKYYLRNRASGTFLTAGNDRATQASLRADGLDITLLHKQNGQYTFNTNISNGTNLNYLGQPQGVGGAVYMDGPAFNYAITPTTDGYYLISYRGVSTEGPSKSFYLGYDEQNPTVLSSRLTDPTDEAAQWQILKRTELIALFKEQAEEATENNPLDITSLVSAPNFSRNDQRNTTAWKGTALTIDGDANNLCAEVFNASFNTYQVLTNLPAGTYRLKAQGFYRHGLPDAAYTAYGNNTEDGGAVLYANTESVPLVSVFSEAHSAGFPANAAGRWYTPSVGYTIPDDMLAASTVFSAGYYQNQVDVEVGEEGRLRIGFKKTAGAVPEGNWSIFDNVRLYILHLAEPTGIEFSTEYTEKTENTEVYDLTGRRLNGKPERGIYIQGGKKYIIK